MKLIYGGAEVPSNRILLIEAGIKDVGVSFANLMSRLPKRKKYLLADRFPEDVRIHVQPGIAVDKYTPGELEEMSEHYQLFVSDNVDRITSWTEFDAVILGYPWLHNQRLIFWDSFDEPGFQVVWHPDQGVSLEDLAQTYSDIAIPGSVIESEPQLAGRANILHRTYGNRFHALGASNPEGIDTWITTATTLAWTQPMRRGETIIFDGGRLLRYPARMKTEARARHRPLIERLGMDWEAIARGEPAEISRLTLWSLREMERAHYRAHQTPQNEAPRASSSGHEQLPEQVSLSLVVSDTAELADDTEKPATGKIVDFPTPNADNNPAPMRHELLPRSMSERAQLPVFGATTKQVLTDGVLSEVPVLVSRHFSLRQCNTCFVAARCPAFKENSECAFSLPVEIKTRDQLVSLLNALVEMQSARVAFARYAEELNGGAPDKTTSDELDRLFRLIEKSKTIQENREVLKLTMERQSSGGILSSIFGDRAQVLTELPNSLDEPKLIQAVDPD